MLTIKVENSDFFADFIRKFGQIKIKIATVPVPKYLKPEFSYRIVGHRYF